MATDLNEQKIVRVSDVSTADQKVEILLDNNILKMIIEEYSLLKTTFDGWFTCMKGSEKGLSQNTAGDASDTFEKMYNDFDVEWFRTMYNNLTIAIPVLEKANLTATNLLWRCEDFYTILLGGEVSNRDAEFNSCTSSGFSGMINEIFAAPMVSRLYLNAAYYDSGLIKLDTDNTVQNLINIAGENEELDRILQSLEMGKIDHYPEIVAVDIDCHKRQRLEKLLASFEIYVKGVGNLNTDTEEGLKTTIYREMMCNNPRTYEYPYVVEEKEIAILDVVARNELHEMGLTDKMIDKALKDGKFTLNSLAACMEAVLAEDLDNEYDGKEVELVLSILNGTPNYGCVDEDFVKKTEKCWDFIAIYQMGEINTVYKNSQSSMDAENRIKLETQLNAIMGSDHPELVFKALRKSAYKVAIKSFADYVYASKHYSAQAVDISRELFRKNLLMYDTYAFLGDKIDSDKDKFKDWGFSSYYEVKSVKYDSTGLDLNIERTRKPGKIKIGEYKIENFVGNARRSYFGAEVTVETFDMKIDEVMGPSEITDAVYEDMQSVGIDKAYAEQKELLNNLIKDGASIGADMALPGSGSIVEFLYDCGNSKDFDAMEEYAGKSSQYAIEQYCKRTGLEEAKGFYDNASTIVNDIDKYVKYDGIQEAQNSAIEKDRAKLVGSAGRCIITGDSVYGQSEPVNYARIHEGITDPAYGNTLSEISTEPKDGNKHGLAKLCNWDEDTVNGIHERQMIEEADKRKQLKAAEIERDKIKKEMEQARDVGMQKYQLREEYENQVKTCNDYEKDLKALENEHAEENKLIDGGYVIDENTDYSKLNSQLTEISNDYNNLQEKNPDSRGVYEGWCSGVNHIR